MLPSSSDPPTTPAAAAAAVPCRAARHVRRSDVRHRAAGWILPEYRFAHRIEEPAGLLWFARAAGLQFLDAAVGALQRFVLEQDRLYQRVNGIGRFAQTLGNGCNGVRIARGALHPEEPVEKIINQLAFLRCHGFSPSLASKREGDVGGLYVASSGAPN